MEHIVWMQCSAAEQCFYLSFPPYVLSLLYPPSSLVSSVYRLPMHLMPKGNYAAGTATAASYLILPKGANWCWQHPLQAEVLSCSFFEMVQSITRFSFPHSQEESQMLAFPLLCFFFLQPQNALGNETVDFSSSSSCCLGNISNKQIQFTL